MAGRGQGWGGVATSSAASEERKPPPPRASLPPPRLASLPPPPAARFARGGRDGASGSTGTKLQRTAPHFATLMRATDVKDAAWPSTPNSVPRRHRRWIALPS